MEASAPEPGARPAAPPVVAPPPPALRPLPPPPPQPPAPITWWLPSRTVLVPLGGAGADRPWRCFVVTAPCVLGAVVLLALGRTGGSDALSALGGVCIFGAVLSGFMGLAGLSSLGNASRAARRLSGDLGATTFGSSDPEALRRQATLSAIAAQGPFDSARVVQRRWLRSFATLAPPHPALLAERFRAVVQHPSSPVEGRVMAALGGGVPLVGVLAGLVIMPMVALAVMSSGRGAAAGQSWLGMAMAASQFALLAALVVMLPLALLSGTRPMRRMSAAMGGWVEIGESCVRDRRGRCWSPADSVLVIAPRSDSGRSAMARLVGPAGVRRLSLGSAASAETGRLLLAWSRWCEALSRRSEDALAAGTGAGAGIGAGTGAGNSTVSAATRVMPKAIEEDESLLGAERWLAGAVGTQKLEEVVPAAVAPAEWRDGADDAVIVTATFPLLRPLGLMPLVRRIVIMLALQVVVLVAMVLINPRLLLGMTFMCFPAIVLGTPLIVAFIRFIGMERDRMAAARSARRVLADPTSSEPSRAIAVCLESTTTFGTFAAESARWTKAVGALSPKPLAIVAPGLLLHVRALGRTERFLEPHSLEPGAAGGAVLAAGAVNAALSIFMAIVGNYWIAIPFGVIALATLVRVPFIWYRLPMQRGGRRSIFVGPGWVRDSKERIWSVRDSTMIVAPATDKGGIFARLVGPPGVRDIPFAFAGDPEFTALWRLWTHRDPRPELAVPQ